MTTIQCLEKPTFGKKIRLGDEVIVISGREKGKRGKIKKVLRSQLRVIIENLNLVTKHVKAKPHVNEPGGLKKIEAPIHVSNVALYNPLIGKPDKVGFKILENGKKVRYFKSNGELVDAQV